MFKTNEYFDGNVVSIAFENNEGKATVGVMAKGEYEFGTTTDEYMTVVSGEMTVLLPGEDAWKTVGSYDTFKVEKDQTFKVKLDADCAYKCIYK